MDIDPAEISNVVRELDDIAGKLDEIIIILSRLASPRPVMLPVPYRSQHDQDAQISRLDCGPACVAMILQFYGKNIAIDDVTRIAGLDSTNANELKSAAENWNVHLMLLLDIAPHEIEDLIDAGRPMIALVDYAKFGDNRQDRNYNGLHWVVIVGYDAKYFYINDPDYWSGRRLEGDKHPVTRDTFIDAQETLAKGGKNRQVLIA